MLVKLIEVVSNGALTTGIKYSLREVMVNPEHVIMVREDHQMVTLNEQGVIVADLNEHHTFSKITINRGQNGSEIIVVGAPSIIEKQLNCTQQLLRG